MINTFKITLKFQIYNLRIICNSFQNNEYFLSVFSVATAAGPTTAAPTGYPSTEAPETGYPSTEAPPTTEMATTVAACEDISTKCDLFAKYCGKNTYVTSRCQKTCGQCGNQTWWQTYFLNGFIILVPLI